MWLVDFVSPFVLWMKILMQPLKLANALKGSDISLLMYVESVLMAWLPTLPHNNAVHVERISNFLILAHVFAYQALEGVKMGLV